MPTITVFVLLETLSAGQAELIRQAARSNQLAGGSRFIDEIEKKLGTRIEMRGRPKNCHLYTMLVLLLHISSAEAGRFTRGIVLPGYNLTRVLEVTEMSLRAEWGAS